MKILCVIDSLCQGGAQRQLIELAIGFKDKGHQVSFLTYHNIPFFNHIIENAGIGITCMEEKNYISRLFKMRRFIRKGDFNAVLSFLEGASFISEFAGIPRKKWRLVVGERNANRDIKRSFLLRFYRLFHLFTDYVVANSVANMKLVKSINPFLPASKCKVIYNIIDFNRWKPDSNSHRRNGSSLQLLVAARVSHQKNIKGLTDALTLLEENERDRISIHWYGSMPEDAKQDKSVKAAFSNIRNYGLERVIKFFPAIQDLDRVVKHADAVGLFSLYEGFPNSVCEGMAMAKPVICAAVSDIPDFLSHEPELLFNPEEAQSISNALRHLINMKRDQLIRVGLENEKIARERFNSDSIVNEYLELLSS